MLTREGYIGLCRRGFDHVYHMHSDLHRAWNKHAICLLDSVKNQVFNKCCSPLIWNPLDTIVLLYQYESAESFLLQLALCKELRGIKIWSKRRWGRETKPADQNFLHQMLLHRHKKNSIHVLRRECSWAVVSRLVQHFCSRSLHWFKPPPAVLTGWKGVGDSIIPSEV